MLKIQSLAVIALCTTVLGLSNSAQARSATKAFSCTGKLEYAIWENGRKSVKEIDLNVSGERSAQNTLVGGVYVQAGELSFQLNAPSAYLSDDVIELEGGRSRGQIYFKLAYLRNSDGSTNPSNSVSVTAASPAGNVTATTEKISTDDPNDVTAFSCEIEQ